MAKHVESPFVTGTLTAHNLQDGSCCRSSRAARSVWQEGYRLGKPFEGNSALWADAHSCLSMELNLRSQRSQGDKIALPPKNKRKTRSA
jgi:hypothetical protein